MPTGFVTRALAAALARLILALGGCAQDKEAYVVGGVFSITGPASYLGEPERNTLQMLVDEANAKGGIKGTPLTTLLSSFASSRTTCSPSGCSRRSRAATAARCSPSNTP